MRGCWAASLGDCDGPLSGEHLVSASLFADDVVTVQGFNWCPEGKKIPLKSLTANVLCVKHNTALSPVDTVGGQAFSVIREMHRLREVRAKMKPRVWNIKRYDVDGKNLERWFLKTLINLCCHETKPVGLTSAIPARPSSHLVRVAYGLEDFSGKSGLYSVAWNHSISMSDGLGFSSINYKGTHIVGGIFSFAGWRLFLYLDSEGPPADLGGVSFAGANLGDGDLLFHPKGLKVMCGKYLSHVLECAW